MLAQGVGVLNSVRGGLRQHPLLGARQRNSGHLLSGAFQSFSEKVINMAAAMRSASVLRAAPLQVSLLTGSCRVPFSATVPKNVLSVKQIAYQCMLTAIGWRTTLGTVSDPEASAASSWSCC